MDGRGRTGRSVDHDGVRTPISRENRVGQLSGLTGNEHECGRNDDEYFGRARKIERCLSGVDVV